MAMPELVEFAERLEFDPKVVVPCLQRKLAALDLASYGTVVLGCTHFPFFTDSLRQVLPAEIDIIDGAAGTIRHLKHKLEEQSASAGGNGEIQFFSSGGEADIVRVKQAFAVARSLI